MSTKLVICNQTSVPCYCRYFAHVGRLAATANSLLLHKGLRNRMWDDSCHVARQIPGIGSLLADRLAAAGIDHLRKLQEADPRRIETVTQRHYPFGEHGMPAATPS